MKPFRDKVVLITGATSGIGKATALEFAKAGAKVVAAGRRAVEGAALAGELKALGAEALFVRTDVAVEADVQALVEKTLAAFGRLDVAFNNAGVEHLSPVVDDTAENYRRVFDINVLGVLLSLKHEIPAMLKTGGGAIINTSSVAGHIGMAGAGVYAPPKHAVEGLTKTAALEFAPQGIRVNAVAPGAIVTDMIQRFAGGPESDAARYIASLHPIGRMGRAEEVAAAVLFLASPEASFITGHSLAVDGGFLAR
ncbi:MAG TPA: glucose 1-dehydrogenase [Verrucomicrobiota bacterium]|nr:glucose 1-dehydrogenase [Verrucomicrobiota bacterium]